MRLVACSECHAQYDVSEIALERFDCRCGTEVEVAEHKAVDAEVHRCGSCGAIVSSAADDCAYCGSEIQRDTHKLSLLCPECFARNRDEARFCTACGVGFRPEPIPSHCVELPCPACTALMPGRSIGGLVVNECGRCHGLWVPEDRFDQLVQRAIDAQRERDPIESRARPPRVTGGNPALDPVAYRRCPHCEHLMQRINFRRRSGVIIDQCRDHGTWLDADELEGIVGFVLSGGLAAAEEAERLSAEAERRKAEARVHHEFARISAENGMNPLLTRAPHRRGGMVGSILEFLTTLIH